jgi:hypothetical protein
MLLTTTIKTNDYQYTGTTIALVPHGYGTFLFENSRYIGNVAFGQPNKYGTYILQNGYYQGFFSRGKPHGLGTFENSKYIYKGQWKYGKKHGKFTLTDKLNNSTYEQKYKNDLLCSNIIIKYILPNNLKTTEEKQLLTANSKCIICYTMDKDSCGNCGHIVCCYTCLQKCSTCPLCRASLSNITKLYYN